MAHPKLAAFVKTQDWLVESGEYLTFPENRSVFKGGVQHYLESIEEVSPPFVLIYSDIRTVLDIPLHQTCVFEVKQCSYIWILAVHNLSLKKEDRADVKDTVAILAKETC